MPEHIVLLGDSILDNDAYVSSGGAVIDALRRLQPAGTATLLARDGAVLSSVSAQLQHVPTDASLLVISAGGNDALGDSRIIREPARSVADALSKLLVVRDRFSLGYHAMLDAAQQSDRRFAVCSIYDVQVENTAERRLANLALALLNDVITGAAVSRRLPLLDLRVSFTDPADYANAIEPSSRGSEKIARAILEMASRHDFSGPSASYI